MAADANIQGRWRHSYAFWTLVILLAGAFLLGGSARDDVLSLILLRPLAVICLAIGLFGLTRDEIARFRGVLIGAGALLLLVALHLVPLPPSLWTALPGRELAAEVATVGGIDQPWRPIALVPWRAWNALFALIVPAAALILAIGCTPRQREQLAGIILILVLLSILVAMAQVAGGYREALYPYAISSDGVPTGLFANRNHFAAILCCSVPLLVLIVGQERGPTRLGSLGRWLAAAIGAGSFLLLLMTGSRAGLFLALVALALAPLVYPVQRRTAGMPPRRYLILAITMLAVLLVIALAVYFARAESINRLMASAGSEELRFVEWGPIADLVAQYFPVGSGVGSFVEVYRVAEPRELLITTYLNHAHNDWLEWALEMGLPGMLLLAAAVAGWAWRSVRLLKASPGQQDGVYLARAGAIIILLLALASLVDYPVRVPSVACVLAIAAVWMASAFQRRRDDGRAQRPEEGGDAAAAVTEASR